MSVLVDTSIWVDYFRSGTNSEKLDFLIDENLLVTNDLFNRTHFVSEDIQSTKSHPIIAGNQETGAIH